MLLFKRVKGVVHCPSEVMATMVEEGVLKHRSESRRRYVGEESHVP